jgi:F-type H+-transporting ATPase subunit b
MATETTAPVSACVDAGGYALGMPQLCVDWIPNQIFWLVITLAAIYFVLSRIALPRIGGVLAERKGTITNDLSAAEELKLRAIEAEKAYEKALADAHAEAQKIAAQARAEVQKDLDAATARAEAQISARAAESESRIGEIRASALESVSIVARDVAQDIVRALGGSADAATVDAAVQARLKG